MPDKIKEVRVFKFPHATARVQIPDLTEEEYNRRWKIVHDAAAALLRDAERVKMEKARKEKENEKQCV